MRKTQPTTYLIVVALLVVVLAGCGGSVSYNYTRSHCASQVATSTGPIAVEATADCSASISAATSGNVSTVTYRFGDNRQIVIDTTSILIDGNLAHNVPPGTKKITINVKSGKVTVEADGQTLPSAAPMNAEQEVQ